MSSSNVSRSVYQSLKEENKRLIGDIRILVSEFRFNDIETAKARITVIEKWRSKFKQDSDFDELLKYAAKEYLKEHPEYNIKNNKLTTP